MKRIALLTFILCASVFSLHAEETRIYSPDGKTYVDLRFVFCLAQQVGDVKQSIYRFRSGDWRLLKGTYPCAE